MFGEYIKGEERKRGKERRSFSAKQRSLLIRRPSWAMLICFPFLPSFLSSNFRFDIIKSENMNDLLGFFFFLVMWR